ncbi:MAG: TetR/AcrR family transcriptional regulator [Saprospiraceae bacterium]|nr:TetR/AcrR family transcriptional regulator [Saprospiraceae bacterium]
MPKQTFLNLEEGKRKQFVDAFLREFSIKTFDEASITEVVKLLGIAKGSVYQYFESKLDLFLFLLQECVAVKMKYVATIERKDYADFWMYFRDLYVYGVQFDEENPLQSHFLHNLVNNLNSPSTKELYKELEGQSVLAFEAMAKKEMELGLFRDDIPTQTIGFLLYKIGVSIQEEMEYSGAINPKESIQNNSPVYQGKQETLLKLVDQYIQLVKPAFDKQ